MVRFKEDRRFRFGRNEEEENGTAPEESRHVTLRRSSSAQQRRIRPRSVSWLFILFVIVLMAIILLR